jgi:large subunit ribosomal protein L29
VKPDDYRKMTDEELGRELEALRKNLFSLRTKQVTDLVEKHHAIRQARRDIARVLTILQERKNKPAGASKP